MHWKGIPAILAISLLPVTVWSQGQPLGPEFRVNTSAYGQRGSVATDASGNFVVVWTNLGNENGYSEGVFGQRYDSGGVPLGTEFHVNTYTTGPQRYPSVASDASGNFVVVWASNGQDGSGEGVFGQRFASSGAPLGSEFRVNSYTTDYQAFPTVASDPSGNFVVVWGSFQQDGYGWGAFGQRFASSGAAQGSEFRVNTYTTGHQGYEPFGGTKRIAFDAAGNFVVVWSSFLGGPADITGQRYASSGAPLGSEFQINTDTTADSGSPNVASDPAGNFVVVWTSFLGGTADITGQRYASSGAPLGSEFQINTDTTGVGGGGSPVVASDSAGNFIVVWDSSPQGSVDYEVFGQRYGTSGVPLGPEFRVNTYTTLAQQRPSLTADSSGNFVVIWDSMAQGGNVFGQRFGQIVPVELMRFGVE